MMGIYNAVLFQPLLNLLVFLYNVLFSDMGVAIIVLTLIIRGILWPVTHKSLHSQRAMMEIQPKVDEVKKQYKDNKEEQAKKMMEVYAQHKVSPMSSCLPLLIQLPILIALYQVLTAGLKSERLDSLYGFVANPEHISTLSLGFLDLSARSIPLALMAAAAQFWQAKMMQSTRPPVKGKDSKDEDMTSIMNKQMLYMMPLMTLFIGWGLPSGLMLYWLFSTLAMVGQQMVFFKQHPHRMPGVDAPAIEAPKA
jgi:YidC/Oxa1 family membrane protein insertase